MPVEAPSGVMDDDGFTSMGDTVRVRVEGDLVFIRNYRVMTLVDLHALIDVYKRVHREQGSLFVMFDCTRSEGMERAARQALSDSQSKEAFVNATAIFGAPFAIRTLANMMDRALVGLGKRSTGIKFFEGEAQARAYLQKERERLKAKG